MRDPEKAAKGFTFSVRHRKEFVKQIAHIVQELADLKPVLLLRGRGILALSEANGSVPPSP